jgi:hypothetical protein
VRAFAHFQRTESLVDALESRLRIAVQPLHAFHGADGIAGRGLAAEDLLAPVGDRTAFVQRHGGVGHGRGGTEKNGLFAK